MSSFYAELEVAGNTYPLRQCQFGFEQAADARGRVVAKVRHGQLHLTLDVPHNDLLLDWANTAHKLLTGHITFFDTGRRTARETVSFTAGQCVSYQESFTAGDAGEGAYVCQLIIATAEKLELTSGGPAGAFVAPAAREYALPAALPTPAAAVPTPSTTRLEELTTVMGASVDVPAAVAGWIAGGLDEGKLRGALYGAVDQRMIFERLQNADKGIFQQRVVIDDYDHIPGVSKQLYQENGLPATVIPASNFGVADAAYDLPARNAITFTDSAELVKLKPGEKIYRVTNDPATDPYGKTGGYWTRTPPTQLANVIGGTAVMPEWNNFQRVYELTVPHPDPANSLPDFYAWEGPTAAQPLSGIYPEKKDNGFCLAGGETQLFLTNNLTRNPAFGQHIQDITQTHKSW